MMVAMVVQQLVGSHVAVDVHIFGNHGQLLGQIQAHNILTHTSMDCWQVKPWTVAW
jgi:hypothetical protein